MGQLMISFTGDGVDRFSLTLERFMENLADATPMFESLADAFGKANQEQFSRTGGHYGSMWAPLSPAYAAWKAKRYPGKPILQREGLLRESLTSRPFGVDEVHSKGMTVGTGVPYAKFHQNGTDTMPARPLIGTPTSADRKRFSTALHDWVVEGRVSV